MITIDPPDCFGFTIFCDDIRDEIGGKHSFIGTYSGRLFVHGDFPLAIPKFGFGISYAQRREVFDPIVEIRIYLPGDSDEQPSIQTGLSEQDMRSGASEAQTRLDSIPDAIGRYIVLRHNLVLAPLVISQAGMIKVRAVRGDTLVRIGSLQIHRASLPAPPNPQTL